VPALDHRDPNGYQITLADGSVRSLGFQDAALLPQIITRDGGEFIQWPPVPPLAGTTTVVTTPTLLPTAPVVASPAPPGRAVMAGMSSGTSMGAGASPEPGGAVMAGISGMTPIQALEQRMQKVEEKLDLILRKLDAAGIERRR
jgi:hypothetical protein